MGEGLLTQKLTCRMEWSLKTRGRSWSIERRTSACVQQPPCLVIILVRHVGEKHRDQLRAKLAEHLHGFLFQIRLAERRPELAGLQRHVLIAVVGALHHVRPKTRDTKVSTSAV